MYKAQVSSSYFDCAFHARRVLLGVSDSSNWVIMKTKWKDVYMMKSYSDDWKHM